MAGTISKRCAAFDNGKTFTIPAVKVQWLHLAEVDTAFNKRQWSLNVILSPKQAEEFKEVGFNVKVNKDGDSYIQPYKKETTSAGLQKPPRVKMKDEGTSVGDIGNGSVLNVEVYAKYMTINNTEMLVCYLNGVEVVELVEYKSDDTEIPF